VAEPNIIIKTGWIKKDGDCSKCHFCNDVIFGNKYSFAIKIAGKIEVLIENVCESCYNQIKED